MTEQATTITVSIRVHRNDILDEEGTISRTATVTSRAAAARWINRQLPLIDSEVFSAVGEATEYEDDPLDGLVPVAIGHFAPGDDRVEWWSM